MKKILVSLCLVVPVIFLSGCTEAIYTTAYTPAYYAAPVSTYAVGPSWGYTGYGYDSNWYGGTPNYYDTSIYLSGW